MPNVVDNRNTEKVLKMESFPMNGSDSLYSYTENSYLQRIAGNVAKAMTSAVIEEKLDVEIVSSSSKCTFRLADLGCSVGPNTFMAVQNIIDAVQHKLESKGLASHIPEFQVFFNDHAANDFNTLFSSLPHNKPYFANGVPGSFYGRLFPKSSLHFVYSSFALHWLSKVPEELLNKNSPAWNKGRIFYIDAPDEVGHAYATQFADDMTTFLDARAQELVAGGLMVLVMPTITPVVPPSIAPEKWTPDFLGYCLMDMAKEGLIDEAQVNSFNLPIYLATPKEMANLVERNGFFSIERMEITNSGWSINDLMTPHTWVMSIRVALECVIKKHFGVAIANQLFDRFYKKSEELSNLPQSTYMDGVQLFVVLKRI